MMIVCIIIFMDRINWLQFFVAATIVFLSLLVILAVILYIFTTPKQTTPEELSAEPVLLTETELQEAVASTLTDGELTACDAIVDAQYKEVCRSNFLWKRAQESLEVNFCAEITENVMPRAMCEQYVVNTSSYQERDISLCDEAVSESVRSDCRNSYGLRLAQATGAVDECQNAVDENVCVDQFLFATILQTSPDMWDCSQFATESTRVDCGSLKTAFIEINTPDPGGVMTACSALIGTAFAPLCAGMIGSVPSVNLGNEELITH